MATPERTACPLARDLFIPYLAGEVSPETKAWLERHLAECDECRAALASTADGMPSRPVAAAEPGRQPEPTTDVAWRQLLRRVRRRNLLIVVTLTLALVTTFAVVSWGIQMLRAWGGLPLYQPAPAATTTPAQALDVDLTPLGLTPAGVTASSDGAVARWTDAAGNDITVEARHFASSWLAQEAFQIGSNPSAVILFRLRQYLPDGAGMAMVQDLAACYYVWQTGDWYLAIRVSRGTPNAARVCATIRDVLFATYATSSSAPYTLAPR